MRPRKAVTVWATATTLAPQNGGNGGAVQVVVGNANGSATGAPTTLLELNNVIGTARAPFAGVVASSIGGQGGIASVPWYKPEDPGFVNNNMAIAPVFSIIKAGWNDFYANWGEANGRTYNWLGGNVGQSGAAGDVTVQLTNASVSGNGQFLVGVSASSVGGAIELYPGLAIGDWYQWTQRDWGVRSLGYFLVRDDNTPWLTMPGNAGDVSVTLDNASIDFSGQNLVGVIAISGASPTPLPFNFKNFTGNYPKSGDVSVTISANSSYFPVGLSSDWSQWRL
ncbi:MAG: hypothetical protein LRY53_02070 [Burkholderiaceae bacterium]|nr:hypothetical protein [Burkholderiaceae bacterium]